MSDPVLLAVFPVFVVLIVTAPLIARLSLRIFPPKDTK